MPNTVIYLPKNLYILLQKASKKQHKTPSKIAQESITDYIAENFTSKGDKEC